MTSRFLLTPNTDPEISYTENWVNASDSQFVSIGNLGPPFQPTLHGLTATSGSFSYFFHGNTINVIGTIFVNDPSVPGSSWRCFIDGVSLGPAVFPNTTENNWSLCQQNLPDGPHELQVVANSTSDPVYFDYLLYSPSVGTPLEKTTTYLANNDSSVSFDSTWSASQNAELTSAPEGEVVISFVGDSLDYYGFIPANFPHTSSSAQYSIDGQSPTTFTLPGLNSSSSNPQQSLFNQKFFSTGPLTQGPHTLSVRNRGSSNVTPLTFSFALISNGSTPSRNPSPIPIPTIPSQHHSNHPVGIIAGVAAGVAVAGVIVIAVVVYVVRRRFPSRIHLAENTELRRANTIDPLSLTPLRASTVIAAPATSTTPASNRMSTFEAQPGPARSNTLLSKERLSTEASILGGSNTSATLRPRVSMSVSVGPSQQGSSSSQSHTLVDGLSTSSSQKKDAVTVAIANNTMPPSRRPVHTTLSRPVSQHTSANEITPMLEDNEEIDEDDEDYDVPPPTYTSRADNSHRSEKQHFLVHHNR